MGKLFDYVQYDVDDDGEIVKNPNLVYNENQKGMSWIGRGVYDLFDSEHLFSKLTEPRTWKSAVIYENADLGSLDSVLPDDPTLPHIVVGHA